MGFKKFGTGDVTGTEGDVQKTASRGDWTEDDQEALKRENERADGEKD